MSMKSAELELPANDLLRREPIQPLSSSSA